MTKDPRLLEEVEIALMLEGVYKLHGFDFRNYSYPFLRKRIRRLCQMQDLGTVSALQERVLRDANCLRRLVEALTLTSTAMFKDPEFYLALRQLAIPLLKKESLVRIWQAGCSTGQEAYSLAIMLEEEGIYDRCRIYATDLNKVSLQRAKAGILPLSAMKQYTENYLHSGGQRAFSEYYTANYDGAKINPSLNRNIVFGQHNLATDGYLHEFQLVLIRNLLAHYNEQLRERVLGLVHESISQSGVLALGRWETLHSTGIEKCYQELDQSQKLYRRYCA